MLFCAHAALAQPRLGKPEAPRPNFLIVLADDMTYHDLGAYGSREVHTPNLDRLAEEGLRFRYAFNSSPICAPTRMSLYTGLHPVRNGAWPNHSRVYDDVRSMPHYLKDFGYHVALIGKRHYAPKENFPFEFLGGSHGDTGPTENMDLERISQFFEESAERPWALVMASYQPHKPHSRGTAYTYNPDDLDLPPYYVDTDVTRRNLAGYYAEISYLDAQVGTVLEHLRAAGEEEETLVLFLSEQGAPFPYGKWTCYDTGLRSAAIFRWPGIVAANTWSDAIIQYVDVVPTMIELAGGDPSRFDFDGRSFAEVLRGSAVEHRTYAFGLQTSAGIYEGPEAYGIRTVRDIRYRLIWNVNSENRFTNLLTERGDMFASWVAAAEAGDPFAKRRVAWYQERPEYELYDLEHDPYALHSVAGNPAYDEVFNRLKDSLESWMEHQDDRGEATELSAPDRQVFQFD